MSPARLLISIVKGYRYAVSPWLGSACRFSPSCSAYSLLALQAHGAVAGSYLTLHRIARCHPWCAGGIDPVPNQLPRLFTRLPRARARDGASSPSATNRRRSLP